MFKKVKSILLIVLCLTFMLSSSIVIGADQISSANCLEQPNANSNVVVMEGNLSKDTNTSNGFILTAEKGIFRLLGNTRGIENYIGKKISVQGILIKTILNRSSYPTLLVQSFSPVLDTKKPELVTLQGNLKVNNIEGKHYELVIKDTVYDLTGKIDGIDKYTEGQLLEVKGYIRADQASIWMSGTIFEVVSYTAIINQHDVLEGDLKVVKTTPADKSTDVKLTFYLGTSKGTFELIGNTAGLEKYMGSRIEVTGNYVMTLVKQDPPLFSVISYKLVTPEIKTVILQGTLKVAKIATPISSKPPYEFTLETEKISYKLDGNTAGLEKYDGQQIEVKGTNSPLTIYPPIFVVESFTALPQKTETLKGTISVIKPDSTGNAYKFNLKASDGLYELIGNTSGLEKYDGQQVEVTGTKGVTTVYPPNFNVISYKPIVPTTVTLKGIVTDTPETNVYNLKLKTSNGLYNLVGNTSGMEKYIGQQVEVTGYYTDVNANESSAYSYFEVISYKPIVTSTITLQGIVQIMDPTLNSPRFTLKTSDKVYELIGDINGLSQYSGKNIEVTGNYVETFAPTTYPLFNVISYKLIAVKSQIHTIVSNKLLYFASPEGNSNISNGICTISWSENTTKAFFDAKLNVGKDSYEFDLVSVKSSDNDSITGLYNISKNGIVVAKEVPGKLYGLSRPLNDYFKFYTDDMKWHMSAYVTYRNDF